MKGSILDFLKLAGERPDLARELIDLAARHGFEFNDEIGDDELELVAGGTDSGELTDMQLHDLQLKQQDQAQVVQTFSNVLRQWHDTSKAIINNLRG